MARGRRVHRDAPGVLMHLLVLGALWPVHLPGTGRGPGVLMHLVVLGAF